MLSVRPSLPIIILSIIAISLGTIVLNSSIILSLSIIMPAPSPRTLVEAIIEIRISNLSRITTINLTNINTTFTLVIL